MEQQTTFTFGGKPITFALNPDRTDVFIHGMGVIGTFSQMKEFAKWANQEHVVNNKSEDKNNSYDFGKNKVEPLELMYLNVEWKKQSINVGCLTDTWDKAIMIYNECERLLGLEPTIFKVLNN
jgi:hypothetical protein